MFRSLIFLLVNVVVILVLSAILPGFKVATFSSALFLVIILTILNFTLGYVLKLFTLPLNFLSFGLVGFIINLFVLWISLNIPNGVTVSGSSFDKLILLLIITFALSVGQSAAQALLPENNSRQG